MPIARPRAGPDRGGKFGKWLAAGIGAVGGMLGLNSFPEDTLVHVRPAGATAAEAQAGRSQLKPIGQLKPGDQVLSVAEWKDAGRDPQRDARLAYDTVTEVIESHRPQTLVHVTVDTGATLTATAGHALKTPQGWRDAVLLKRGGQLLLKGAAEPDDGGPAALRSVPGPDGQGERAATIVEVRTEQVTVRVFNLEVAHAHTFFVREEGVLAHNGSANSAQSRLKQVVYRIFKAKTDKTSKFGVACWKNRDTRPRRQLRRGEDYEFVDVINPGPGARGRAYESEAEFVTEHNRQHGQSPPRNKLPRPRR